MKKHSYVSLFLVVCVVVFSVVFFTAIPTQHAAAAENTQDISTCQNCHSKTTEPWSTSKHAAGNVNCLVCHKLGQGEGVHPQVKYTVESEETTCRVCHTNVDGMDVAGQLALSQHGKVGLKCTTCHEPHSQGPVLSPGSKIVCENCHKNQTEGMLKSTHTAAGLNCINCHMGPERSHTLKIAGETCGGCHTDIHEANRILTAGIKVEPVTTPMAEAQATPVPEVTPAPVTGGINLPLWTMVVLGIFIGGFGSWALFGREPGGSSKE